MGKCHFWNLQLFDERFQNQEWWLSFLVTTLLKSKNVTTTIGVGKMAGKCIELTSNYNHLSRKVLIALTCLYAD